MKNTFFRILAVAMLTFSISACGLFKSDYAEIENMQSTGRYAETVPMLEKILSSHPKDTYALFYLGTAHLNLGQLDLAETMYARDLELSKDEQTRSRYRTQYAAEYRKALLACLSRAEASERTRAPRLLANLCRYNSTPEYLAGLANELEKRGNEYLTKFTLDIADAHFSLCAKLDPSARERTAQTMLSLFSKTDAADPDFKAVVIKRAVAYSQSADIVKTHADYFYALSQKAASTEDAVADLEIANQFSQTYGAELQAKKDVLENEKLLELVKKNEEKFGKAKHVRAIKPGEPILAGEVPRHSMITYLSLQEFKVYYSTGKTSIWSAASNEIGGKKIYHDKKMILQFEAIKKPTDIYFWVSEI